MYQLGMLGLFITMGLALFRASRGPTVFDRILGVNVFGTTTVILICVVSLIIGRPDFLDLALLYSLMNFIGMVAVLRFSKFGTFNDTRPAAAASSGRGGAASSPQPPSASADAGLPDTGARR